MGNLSAALALKLDEKAPRLFPVLEITRPSGTLRFAALPIRSTSLGTYQGRISALGNIHYEASGYDGVLSYPSFSEVTLVDHDQTLAREAELGDFDGSPIRLRLGSDDVSPADWTDLFGNGVVETHRMNSYGTWTLTFKFNEMPLRSPFPKTLILRKHFPAAADPALYNLYVMLAYGTHDSRKAGGWGQVPCYYVDTAKGWFGPWAGVIEIERVYVGGKLTTAYTVITPVIGGHQFTLIQFTVPPPFDVLVTADIVGLKANGDGTGALLIGADALKHLLVNFVFPAEEWKTGTYFNDSTAPVSVSHFDAVQDWLETVRWEQTSRQFGGDGRITGEEAVNDFCRSFGAAAAVSSFWTWGGKLAVGSTDFRPSALAYTGNRWLQYDRQELDKSWKLWYQKELVTDRITVKYFPCAVDDSFRRTHEVRDLMVLKESAREVTLPWSHAQVGTALVDIEPAIGSTQVGTWTGGFADVDDSYDTPDDDSTYAEGTGTPSAIFYLHTRHAVPLSLNGIGDVTLKARRRIPSGSGQKDRQGIRIFGPTNFLVGVDYRSAFVVTPGSYGDIYEGWTVSPATGLPWTRSELAHSLVLVEATGGLVRWTQVGLRIDAAPPEVGVGRRIASVMLRQLRRAPEVISMLVDPHILDCELLQDLSLSHPQHPLTALLGEDDLQGIRRPGSEDWQKVLVQLRSITVDLSTLKSDVILWRRRGALATFYDGAESKYAPDGMENGVARFSSGSSIGYSRPSSAWVPEPVSGQVVECFQNERPLGTGGYAPEDASVQYLHRSSFYHSLDQPLYGGSGVTHSGAGTMAGEVHPPDQLFSDEITGQPGTWTSQAMKLTAGNPHGSDSVATWEVSDSIPANETLRFSIDHRDDTAAVLDIQIQRSVGGAYYRASDNTWQAGSTWNSLTVRTTRTRDVFPSIIDIGASTTTVVLRARQASGGTVSRLNRIYHVQLEGNFRDLVTSRILADTLGYTRDEQSYTVEHTTLRPLLVNAGFCALLELGPAWNAADVIDDVPVWDLVFDANNYWSLVYAQGDARLEFRSCAAGTLTVAYIPWVPVNGTFYLVGCRAVPAAGACGLAGFTNSILAGVSGSVVKGTDVVRAGTPTEAAATGHIGTAVAGFPAGISAFNGIVRRILFTPEMFTDAEIQAGRW